MVMDIVDFLGIEQIHQIVIIEKDLALPFPFIDMQIQGLCLVLREMPAHLGMACQSLLAAIDFAVLVGNGNIEQFLHIRESFPDISEEQIIRVFLMLEH